MPPHAVAEQFDLFPSALRPHFDYQGERRGYWATLVDDTGRTVILTESPGTLLSMLRAGVLVGEALRDARALVAESWVPAPPGTVDWTP